MVSTLLWGIVTMSVKCRSRSLDHSGCSKSMSRMITMQGLTLSAITNVEKHTLSHRFMSRSLGSDMLVKISRSQCMLEEDAKYNYYQYVKFDTHTYHCCIETHLNVNHGWTNAMSNGRGER